MDELINVCVKNMVNENFTEEQARTYLKEMHLLHLAALIVITVAYTLILTRTLPKINGNTQMIVSNS